jgi:hypothetical protein
MKVLEPAVLGRWSLIPEKERWAEERWGPESCSLCIMSELIA